MPAANAVRHIKDRQSAKGEASDAASRRPEITTPDKVDSRLGQLEFLDRAPSAATVAKVYDTLDCTHALEAFLNSYGGASA